MVIVERRRTAPARWSVLAFCICVGLLSDGRPAQASTTCADILPDPAHLPHASRPIAVSDLAAIRDIGFSERPPRESPLGVSPSGDAVAFVLTRATPETNSYCQALVVLSLGPGARPTIVDRGGDPILEPINIRGLSFDYGYPAYARPIWSPDGEWIAYLKRQNGVTQAWRVRANGQDGQAVTRSDADIEHLAWSRDGRTLLVASRPGLRAAQQSIEQEGLRGYLLDDRLVPYAGSRPKVRLPVPYEVSSIVLDTEMVRPATSDERRSILAEVDGDLLSAKSPDGEQRAWTARSDPDNITSPITLWAQRPGSKPVRCSDRTCEGSSLGAGLYAMWWLPESGDLLFMRYEGWAGSRTALYRWKPGRVPYRVLSTDDALVGCVLAGGRLLCARESSTRPRRLVSIDPQSGSSRLLFDPNPEFDSLTLGKVERLHWRNDLGLEGFGDLVMPFDYRPGQKIPLIVVQYRSRGFLRGGTGDEFPIFPFAARGYAVLNVNNPAPFFTAARNGAVRTITQALTESSRNWSERRSVHSSLMAGIGVTIARGSVDPRRIGLTGLSDGAATLQYALVNEPGFFAAASASACCTEPTTMMIYGGTALADERKLWGFPPATRDGLEAWKPMSIALNAETVRTPLLMQLADNGYLLGLETFMALREKKRPVEMYVFPDEYHLKWQSAHRRAIYDRNLQWFDFWLLGREDRDPVDPEQYVRWRAMKAAQAME